MIFKTGTCERKYVKSAFYGAGRSLILFRARAPVRQKYRNHICIYSIINPMRAYKKNGRELAKNVLRINHAKNSL
jgi:hypothetical protein